MCLRLGGGVKEGRKEERKKEGREGEENGYPLSIQVVLLLRAYDGIDPLICLTLDNRL